MDKKYVSHMASRPFIWRIEYPDDKVIEEYDSFGRELKMLKEPIPLDDIEYFGFKGVGVYFRFNNKGTFLIPMNQEKDNEIEFYLDDTLIFSKDCKIKQLKGFTQIAGKPLTIDKYVFGYNCNIYKDNHKFNTSVTSTLDISTKGKVHIRFKLDITPDEKFDKEYPIMIKNNGILYDTKQKINCMRPTSSLEFR